MVQPGQFLERPAVIRTPDEDLVLEGLYHRGEKLPPLVFAPPHPMMGGSMDSPVCNEVAFACYKEERPSLRFNFRGVGASRGKVSASLEDAVRDFSCAADFLLDSCKTARTIVGGYSFGSLAAGKYALAHPERASAALLVAPPVGKIEGSFLREISAPGLVLVPQDDAYGPPKAIQSLFEGMDHVRIEVIPRADHFFTRGLADVGRLVREWLRRMGQPVKIE
ncbi:MAG: alpha/beta fold hydrolase [Bdellovibrionota bacterium]